MTEHKRRPISIDHHGSSLVINPAKRHKSTQITLSTKERKERVGERIVALQQLVSPFGKTDTASVLTEAMEYIKFLQDQVKVLSAPYLQSTIQSTTAYEAEVFALCQYRALSELLVAMEQIYGLQSRSTALQRSNFLVAVPLIILTVLFLVIKRALKKF